MVDECCVSGVCDYHNAKNDATYQREHALGELVMAAANAVREIRAGSWADAEVALVAALRELPDDLQRLAGSDVLDCPTAAVAMFVAVCADGRDHGAQPPSTDREAWVLAARRRLPPEALSRTAQQTVDDLLSKSDDPLTPAQRKRFLAAAERALRVRREILTLAAFASGHRRYNRLDSCRECKLPYPCPDVLRVAGPALDAVAELKA